MATKLLTAILPAAAAVVLCGCAFEPGEAGPVQHETKSIDLDKSTKERVEINMGAGELRMEGGSSRLLDADFTYAIPSWRPRVRYDPGGFSGTIRIDQPSPFRRVSNGGPYEWNLRFNDGVPLELVTHLGAGEARMDLGSLNLRSVDVDMGVGQLRLDLRGHPKRDYDVQIRGGVGEATVYLPNDVAIIAEVEGGIGDISARGLEKRDGHWIRAASENALVTIHLDVQGGVGAVKLVAD
jgi:hypothetical protein